MYILEDLHIFCHNLTADDPRVTGEFMGVAVLHGSTVLVEGCCVRGCGVGGFMIDDAGVLNVTGCEVSAETHLMVPPFC